MTSTPPTCGQKCVAQRRTRSLEARSSSTRWAKGGHRAGAARANCHRRHRRRELGELPERLAAERHAKQRGRCEGRARLAAREIGRGAVVAAPPDNSDGNDPGRRRRALQPTPRERARASRPRPRAQGHSRRETSSPPGWGDRAAQCRRGCAPPGRQDRRQPPRGHRRGTQSPAPCRRGPLSTYPIPPGPRTAEPGRLVRRSRHGRQSSRSPASSRLQGRAGTASLDPPPGPHPRQATRRAARHPGDRAWPPQ